VVTASAARAVQPSSIAPTIVVAAQGPLQQPESVLAPASVTRIREVVARLREEKPTWGSLLEHGIVLSCDAEKLEVAYEKRSFFAAQVSDRAVADAFERAAKSSIGVQAKILLVEGGLSGRTLAQLANEAKTAALDAARREAVSHPVVQEAIAIFGAEIKNVKLPGEEV
jgi:hypothetical protein